MQNLADANWKICLAFLPGHFDLFDRPYPGNGLRKATDEERNAYWRACLGDWGIADLQPVTKRSFVVPVEQLTEEHLKLFLTREMVAAYRTGYKDAVPLYLHGGLNVIIGDKVIFSMQCCAGFEDSANWFSLYHLEENGTEMLWLGHPEVYYRRMGYWVYFTRHCESAKWKNRNAFRFKIRVDDLMAKLELVWREIHALETRLWEASQSLELPNTNETISKWMWGNYEYKDMPIEQTPPFPSNHFLESEE